MDRAALVLLAVVLPGCLFIGGINQRPSVFIDTPTPTTTLGVPLTVSVDVTDDDPGAHYDATVLDANGVPITTGCLPQITYGAGGDPSAGSLALTLWAAGTYTLQVVPVDIDGAVGSPATLRITVIDQPPVFVDTTNQIVPGSAPDACGADHLASVPLLVTLRHGARDPDGGRVAPAGCTSPPPIDYTWTIVSQPTGGGALGLPQGGACPPTPAGSVVENPAAISVCLYPDPALPAATPGSYTLSLVIDDGVNFTSSVPLVVTAIGQAPACFDGVFPAAGSYTLSVDESSVFQAVGVDDVTTAAALLYTWSLERPNETAYTPLVVAQAGEDGGARLVLDPTALGFSIGDVVSLRVDVDDGSGSAACADTDDVCTAASCAVAPATTCPRRATWTLEYR